MSFLEMYVWLQLTKTIVLLYIFGSSCLVFAAIFEGLYGDSDTMHSRRVYEKMAWKTLVIGIILILIALILPTTKQYAAMRFNKQIILQSVTIDLK